MLDRMWKRASILPWLLLSLALILAACGASPTPQAGTATPAPSSTPRPPTPTATRPPTPTWVTIPSPAPTATDNGVALVGIGEAWTLAAVDKAVFVDVRPLANYEEERIPDAISMPVDEVAERYKELPGDRLLIFYCNCKAEVESTEAALAAQEQGLSQVAVLQGGWEAWLRAGYLVEGTRVQGDLEAAAGRAMGSPDAPITMVEFSDFECPYCADYALETLPQIIENYIETGLVRYMFKDLPLAFHQHAQKAAEASRCAGAQDSFWPMHDLLFEHQAEWSVMDEAGALAAFVSYAREMELDAKQFEDCLASGEFAEAVTRDQWDAERLGVQMVPAFLINDRRTAGAYPYAEFERLIEEELARAP
ncbi:MAG: thioredoxin domain-containing protein [Anaerolineae bacterium]